MDEFEQMLAERNAALIALDSAYVKRMLPNVPEGMILCVMHKARYECTGIPAEHRHQSRAWSAEHGFGRIDGMPLLPKGELPT